MVLLVIYVAIISTNLRIIEKFPLSCSPIKYTIRAKNTVQTSGKKHINTSGQNVKSVGSPSLCLGMKA